MGKKAGLSVIMALELSLLAAGWAASGGFSYTSFGSSLDEGPEYSFLGPALFVIVIASIAWMVYGLGETGPSRIRSLVSSAYRQINPKRQPDIDEKAKDEPLDAPRESELEESLRVIRELKRAAQMNPASDRA